eukprot:gene20778-22806_t
MEIAGILNVDDENELFILHYVFLPRINRHLTEFSFGWNCHKLSAEKNVTPNQLWISGLHDINGLEGSRIAEEIWEPENNEEAVEYGIDWEGPSQNPDDESNNENGVIVNDIKCPFNEAVFNRLNEDVHPELQSSSFGMDIYMRALEYVNT